MTTTLFTPIVALAIAGFLRQPTDPPAPHPSANPQPGVSSPSDPASVPSDEPPTLHLLTNGRILQGRLIQEGDSYVIRQKIGPVPIRGSELVGSFRTLEDIYRFRVRELPARDPDEHLKLAKWCVVQNLVPQAHRHLLAVMELQPGHPEAARMAANIEAAKARKQNEAESAAAAAQAQARSDRDPNVMAAAMNRDVSLSADADRTDARARALDEARNRYSNRQGAPTIFDLNPSAAIKRTQEFDMYAHRVIQKRCAGCHNERHAGDFQLIQALRRQDWNAQVVLYNMDATLRWVDPKNPARSQLLISALLPHKPTNKPIFSGQNDRDFKILATWVRSLQSTANAATASSTAGNGSNRGIGMEQGPGSSPLPSHADAEERFASDRIDPNSGPPVARPTDLEDDAMPREPQELPMFRSGVMQGTQDNIYDPQAMEDFQRQIGSKPSLGKGPPVDPSSIRPPGSLLRNGGSSAMPPSDPAVELSPLHGGDMSQLRRPQISGKSPLSQPQPANSKKSPAMPPGMPPPDQLYPSRSPEREQDPSKPKAKVDSRVLEGLILRNAS